MQNVNVKLLLYSTSQLELKDSQTIWLFNWEISEMLWDCKPKRILFMKMME